MANAGGQNEYGKIERVLIKHPKDAFLDKNSIDKQWRKLNYYDKPDYQNALIEYDDFVRQLETVVTDIHFLPSDDTAGLDSIYPRDASICTNKGMVLCNMGKAERATEPEICGKYFKENDIPILGRITGNGRVEGGDVVWLNENTMAVGRGYRTNDEGIGQLKELIKDFADVITVPLVHWEGYSDVFHLMSIISPIDKDLALVYSRLLPVPFREYLCNNNIGLVEVSDEEFETMGCNALALSPRKCLMLDGNPVTKARLEKAGTEVLTFKGNEISRKGAGGPTCMTRPLLRLSG